MTLLGGIKRSLGAVAAVTTFYAVVLVVGWLAIQLLIPSFLTRGATGLAATSVPTVLVALAVNWFLVATKRHSWRMLGWRGAKPGVRSFVRGTGLGFVMAGAALAIAVAAGTARIEVTGGSVAQYVATVIQIGGILGIAALAEELVFRGYPLARLTQAFGRVGASVALAVPFVLLHSWNPNVSNLGLANIGLASLVLSAAFFTPGGLPMAWGVHFGWNGGLSLGADAPVSGLDFGIPVLDFVSGGPTWLTGGPFGPEGGLVATLVMGGALIVLIRQVVRGDRTPPADVPRDVAA